MTTCWKRVTRPTRIGPLCLMCWPTTLWNSIRRGNRSLPTRRMLLTCQPAVPSFQPSAIFLPGSPTRRTNDSLKLKAIRLYQQLLSFHQNDEDLIGAAGCRFAAFELR